MLTGGFKWLNVVLKSNTELYHQHNAGKFVMDNELLLIKIVNRIGPSTESCGTPFDRSENAMLLLSNRQS